MKRSEPTVTSFTTTVGEVTVGVQVNYEFIHSQRFFSTSVAFLPQSSISRLVIQLEAARRHDRFISPVAATFGYPSPGSGVRGKLFGNGISIRSKRFRFVYFRYLESTRWMAFCMQNFPEMMRILNILLHPLGLTSAFPVSRRVSVDVRI